MRVGDIRITSDEKNPGSVSKPVFATVTVTNTNDSGGGSLRDAIFSAGTDARSHTFPRMCIMYTAIFAHPLADQ